MDFLSKIHHQSTSCCNPKISFQILFWYIRATAREALQMSFITNIGRDRDVGDRERNKDRNGNLSELERSSGTDREVTYRDSRHRENYIWKNDRRGDRSRVRYDERRKELTYKEFPREGSKRGEMRGREERIERKKMWNVHDVHIIPPDTRDGRSDGRMIGQNKCDGENVRPYGGRQGTTFEIANGNRNDHYLLKVEKRNDNTDRHRSRNNDFNNNRDSGDNNFNNIDSSNKNDFNRSNHEKIGSSNNNNDNKDNNNNRNNNGSSSNNNNHNDENNNNNNNDDNRNNNHNSNNGSRNNNYQNDNYNQNINRNNDNDKNRNSRNDNYQSSYS